MDTLEALRLLRAKGFTGPIEISTSLSDNTVDGEHMQNAWSKVIVYNQRIVEKGERLEDVVRKQVLGQVEAKAGNCIGRFGANSDECTKCGMSRTDHE
jgi:hypothetical protein